MNSNNKFFAELLCSYAAFTKQSTCLLCNICLYKLMCVADAVNMRTLIAV